MPYLLGAGVLTGKLRPEGPRKVVDLFTGMGGGAELELLELRLHELDGVADIVVVTESRFGNRCDKKDGKRNDLLSSRPSFILRLRPCLQPLYCGLLFLKYLFSNSFAERCAGSLVCRCQFQGCFFHTYS